MGGIFHVPSTISFFGQYSRITTLKDSVGAGSQFDSLSGPGDCVCMWIVTDPSGLTINSSRSPIAYLFNGFAMKVCLELYIVSDQNPLTGGRRPLAKRSW